MGFFKDENGRMHIARIAGVLYIVGLLPWLKTGSLNALLVARAAFLAGWWLAFCDKRPPSLLSELLAPRRIAGIIIALSSISGQYYLIGS